MAYQAQEAKNVQMWRLFHCWDEGKRDPVHWSNGVQMWRVSHCWDEGLRVQVPVPVLGVEVLRSGVPGASALGRQKVVLVGSFEGFQCTSPLLLFLSAVCPPGNLGLWAVQTVKQQVKSCGPQSPG